MTQNEQCRYIGYSSGFDLYCKKDCKRSMGIFILFSFYFDWDAT